MSEATRTRILTGICMVLLVIAIGVWYNARPGQRPPPSAPGYYTGPMKSKGDPNIYGNDDGQRVAPPPATGSAAPAPVKAGAPAS